MLDFVFSCRHVWLPREAYSWFPSDNHGDASSHSSSQETAGARPQVWTLPLTLLSGFWGQHRFWDKVCASVSAVQQWYWRLASIRKLLILNISVYTLVQWRVAAGVAHSFKILKEFAVSPGLWRTLMWWDAAGLNYRKESIECEKRKICRSLIPSAWAR